MFLSQRHYLDAANLAPNMTAFLMTALAIRGTAFDWTERRATPATIVRAALWVANAQTPANAITNAVTFFFIFR